MGELGVSMPWFAVPRALLSPLVASTDAGGCITSLGGLRRCVVVASVDTLDAQGCGASVMTVSLSGSESSCGWDERGGEDRVTWRARWRFSKRSQ